jgi:hypothetical protein
MKNIDLETVQENLVHSKLKVMASEHDSMFTTIKQSGLVRFAFRRFLGSKPEKKK